MEITLETLRRFVREHGSVQIEDGAGQTRKLRNGEPDVWELAEKANRFQFEGEWHGRDAFAKLMDERMNPKPLDYRSVPIDVIAREMPHMADLKKKK
jgi:hypothetical protein